MNLHTRHVSDRVDSLGERELIRRIRHWLGPACPASPVGIGDDCAILPASRGKRLVTVDPVIEGRHFDPRTSGSAVGAKLLNRNLSDIAAMGGVPTHAVVALALPASVSVKWIQSFYLALRRTALKNSVQVVGGDVAQAPVFSATLTLLGETRGRRALKRVGAKAGDLIFVTGSLGGSILGHHLRFQPRLAEGRWLAGRSEVISMMDVSDGLAKDLGSLTPQGCRPLLDSNAVPISAAASRLSKRTGHPALQHALADGEDYELAFTVRSSTDIEAFQRAWHRRFATRLSCVGRFRSSSAKPGEGEIDPLGFQGYEHLR